MPSDTRDDLPNARRRPQGTQDIVTIETRLTHMKAESEAALQSLQARMDSEIAAIHAAIQRIENELANGEWQIRAMIVAKLVELNVKGEAAYELLLSAAAPQTDKPESHAAPDDLPSASDATRAPKRRPRSAAKAPVKAAPLAVSTTAQKRRQPRASGPTAKPVAKPTAKKAPKL
jgi:hypothetical protein